MMPVQRSKLGLVVGGLLVVVDFAGGVLAAAQGEMTHAGVHGALFLVGMYIVWRFAPDASAVADMPREATESLTHLEQSVDAIAGQLERIGEGQRFIAQLFAARAGARAVGPGAADPIDNKARDAGSK